MLRAYLHNLRAQIAVALSLLVLLCVGALSYSFYVTELHELDYQLLAVAGELRLTTRLLTHEAAQDSQTTILDNATPISTPWW